MSQEIDISWQVLRRIVRQWAGESAELAEVKPLDGGCINTTLALTTNSGDRAVLKISPHRVDRSYEDEAIQLRLLREAGFPTPDVYESKVGSLDDPFSYILMQFVDGVDLNETRRRASPEQFEAVQSRLAEILLALHEKSDPHYRRVTVDPSPVFESWPKFYRTVFDPIWQAVEKSPLLPIKCRKQIGRVHEKLESLIGNDDKPRLVHWDVWATNVLCAPDDNGQWRITALLDPNCKYAHVESEIAYLELFHTVTPAFMKAYQSARRLNGEYHRVRRPVYQLYSLLNHLELFGQEYLKPVLAAVDRVSALA